MDTPTTPVLAILQAGFARMPAAIFAGLMLALLGIWLWAGLATWRSARVLYLLARTPLGTLGTLASNATGVVKLRGAAQPLHADDPSPVLWQQSLRRWGNGQRTRATRAEPFVLQTNTGDCELAPRGAVVVPSYYHADHAMFDRDRYVVDKAIMRGDELFAIGRVAAASANGAAARSTSCRLRPSWGLLLVSGVSERDAAVLHALWLAVQLPLAVGCLVLALWGGRVHLSTYPGTPAQVRAGFAEALMTFPLENDPGLELEVRQERAASPGR